MRAGRETSAEVRIAEPARCAITVMTESAAARMKSGHFSQTRKLSERAAGDGGEAAAFSVSDCDMSMCDRPRRWSGQESHSRSTKGRVTICGFAINPRANKIATHA